MGRYSSFAGKQVEAHYRAGNIRQRSVGTLVADTGASVTIEEHFSQGGRDKIMRVDIPYEYVIRIVASSNVSPTSVAVPASSRKLRR
jgi:hypothetical protein